MNETHRAVALCTVYMYTAQDVVQCVSQATLSVSSCVYFVAGTLRRIHAEALLPPPLCPAQWRSREDGRGGGGRLRKGGLWCNACDVSRVSLVHARAARAE